MSKSAALLRNAFQVTGDAVVFLDRDGFFECNPAALRIFGYTEKTEFLRKHPSEFSPPVQPDGRSSFEAAEAYMRLAYERGHIAFSWDHLRSDGTIFPTEIMLASVDFDGVQALSATVRDVSARRAVEEELRRQRESLHQSEKLAALGSLLAGVAHELNNPLAVVVTQAVLLRETSADRRTIERAQKIEAAAERCSRIVKSFLAIARQRPPSRAPVALDDVVESALDLTIYGLRSGGITVSIDVPSGLPNVIGDADQLGQLAMNLIVNAQQALHRVDRARRLRITGCRRGGQIRLAFADNGPGVPDALRSRIYDPFFTTKVDRRDAFSEGVGMLLRAMADDLHTPVPAVRQSRSATRRASNAIAAEPGVSRLRAYLEIAAARFADPLTSTVVCIRLSDRDALAV